VQVDDLEETLNESVQDSISGRKKAAKDAAAVKAAAARRRRLRDEDEDMGKKCFNIFCVSPAVWREPPLLSCACCRSCAISSVARRRRQRDEDEDTGKNHSAFAHFQGSLAVR